MAKEITAKMKAFAAEYVKNGYNGTEAYHVAYGQDNRQVCSTEAYRLLRDERIVREIEAVEGSFRVIGQLAGIDKKAIVGVLSKMMVATKKEKDGTEVPDNTARKDAITLFAKLTGDFKDKRELKISKKEELTDVDPTKLEEDELEKLEDALMNEL